MILPPPGADSLSSSTSLFLVLPFHLVILHGRRAPNLIPYDSFGTSMEHSLPRKSLFFVTFIQYNRAFSLLSVKNPTPPDFRRSSLHESTFCPSIDVRN